MPCNEVHCTGCETRPSRVFHVITRFASPRLASPRALRRDRLKWITLRAFVSLTFSSTVETSWIACAPRSLIRFRRGCVPPRVALSTYVALTCALCTREHVRERIFARLIDLVTSSLSEVIMTRLMKRGEGTPRLRFTETSTFLSLLQECT